MKQENSTWIWTYKKGYKMNTKSHIVYFRKVLDLVEAPKEMMVHVSADSKYKLYVNGMLVNVGPQKGDGSIWYYDKLDLSSHVKSGKNVIVIAVLSIPNRHNSGNHAFYRTDTPGLYLKGSYKLDKIYDIIADSSWKCRNANIVMKAENPYFAPLQIFEDTTGTILDCGMLQENYDDSGWDDAKAYYDFQLPAVLRPEHLVERKIPLLYTENRRFESLQCRRQSIFSDDEWNEFICKQKSITIPACSKEVIEISAGEETTGYLKIMMAGGESAKISILTSECYAYEPDVDYDGFIMPEKRDRTDSVKGKLFGFTDTYLVCGKGTLTVPEIYEPYWFRTFRYIQLTVETGDEPLTLSDLSYMKNGYPLDVTTAVETSDVSLEKVWEISERTLRLCMHETYEDCPFYEQLQYAMDSRSQILYTYAVSADDRLARQCMDDFKRATRYDGMINCSYPNYETNVIPGFAIYYIGMVYDHMMYFGDREMILEHTPTIMGILNFFRKNITDIGIVGKIGGPNLKSRYWSFIDWTEQWKETMGVPLATYDGPLTMESLLYIMGLQYASRLYDFVGYKELSKQLEQEAKELQQAVNLTCRGKDGMYKDGPITEQYSQHTHVFSILTETVKVEEGRKYLKKTFDNKEEYAQCSVAMMYYLYRALEKCGMYEKTDELWELWRDMVKKNLTTCEEDSVLSRSDCHAWGALALYELPSVVLGVRPSAPGFSEMTINPKAGHLTWAKGRVITPKGIAGISWKQENNKIKVTASIPYGINIKECTDSEEDQIVVSYVDDMEEEF